MTLAESQGIDTVHSEAKRIRGEPFVPFRIWAGYLNPKASSRHPWIPKGSVQCALNPKPPHLHMLGPKARGACAMNARAYAG